MSFYVRWWPRGSSHDHCYVPRDSNAIRKCTNQEYVTATRTCWTTGSQWITFTRSTTATGRHKNRIKFAKWSRDWRPKISLQNLLSGEWIEPFSSKPFAMCLVKYDHRSIGRISQPFFAPQPRQCIYQSEWNYKSQNYTKATRSSFCWKKLDECRGDWGWYLTNRSHLKNHHSRCHKNLSNLIRFLR